LFLEKVIAMKNKHIVVISITDIISAASTNAEGFQLFSIIDKEFKSGNFVKLSLTDSPPMSSSFLNSSFGSLLDSYGYTFMKNHLSLINVTKSKAERIKGYLDDVNRYYKS
jgi:hypothetical protein